MTIAVIGLGNVLLGDDGFGPHVVEYLRRTCVFPDEVELLDLGTPGLGLAGYVCGRDMVVIVDAVKDAGAPGDVRIYTGAELEKLPSQPRINPHDPAVPEALAAVRLAGKGPREVWLVGAVTASLEPGAGLSPQMRQAVGNAAVIVCRLIREKGFEIRPCETAAPAQGWWAVSGT